MPDLTQEQINNFEFPVAKLNQNKETKMTTQIQSDKNQANLSFAIDELVGRLGDRKAINEIKNSTADIFKLRQNYPTGVFVYCDSEEGGVMLGTR